MPDKTRIVFWGSPKIAADFLLHLAVNYADRFHVVACVTQTEKTVQRQGKSTVRSAVHNKAEELGIPVFTPQSVKKEADVLLQELGKIGYDIFVVLAYGKILPESVISAPRLKSVNFHGSLLPLLRGASPIEHALLYDFKETGWTLQRIVAALDAGDIIAQSKIPVNENETTETLYPKMTQNLLGQGANMLIAYVDGTAEIHSQNETLATHCRKISAEEGKLDFTKPAAEIRNRYRAFTPRPGVFAFFRGKKVKLGFDLGGSPPLADLRLPQAPLPASGEGVPKAGVGTLLRQNKTDLFVLCGDRQALQISSITPEGKKAMAPADFINGYRLVGANDRIADGDKLE